MFWSKEISVASFLTYLEFRCRYAGYGQFEYSRREDNNTVVIRHNMGITWSIFLKSYIGKVLSETLGIIGKFEVAENTILIKFSS